MIDVSQEDLSNKVALSPTTADLRLLLIQQSHGSRKLVQISIDRIRRELLDGRRELCYGSASYARRSDLPHIVQVVLSVRSISTRLFHESQVHDLILS